MRIKQAKVLCLTSERKKDKMFKLTVVKQQIEYGKGNLK